MINNKDDSVVSFSVSSKEVTMTIKPFLFEKIEPNDKIVEACLATEKYSGAHMGDTIKFLCGTKTTPREITGKAKYIAYNQISMKN